MANLELTPEIIQELKGKHGENLHKMEVPLSEPKEDGSEFEVLVLKKMTRVIYSAASKVMAKDEIQGAEVFLRGLTVFGDVDAVIKDFDALRAAMELLVPIIGVKPGNVTKL